MKGLIVVAFRELIDRRAVLGAAVAAAFIPVLLPFLPGFANYTASEVRGATAAVIALLFGWVLAAVFGSSMVASELHEDRLGFFYARPLRTNAIWFGKVLAGFVLVSVTEVVILLPTVLMPSSRPHLNFDDWEAWAVIGVVFGVPLLILHATHALGIVLRTKSAWVIVDALALVVLGLAIWASTSPLLIAAPKAFVFAVIFVLVALVAALIGSGAVQMKVGRTDLQRSHRALSTVLWGSLLIVVFLVIGFRWWLFAVEPGDIVRIANVEAAQKGDWVVVDGLIDGHFDYQPRFLVNAESGAFLKVAHGGWMNYMDVAISGDGTTAAWLEPAGKESWRLVSAQLGERAATRTNTDLFFSAPAGLRLSERGDRIAALESRVVSIYEMKTGRLILAAPMKEDERVGLARWISDDVLRLYSSVNLSLLRAAEVVITEIDVSAGSVAVRGSLEIEYDDPAPDGVRNRRWLRSDPARDRLLDIQRQPDGWWWSFRDAATGTLIVDLGKRDSYRALAFLSDGRFVHPVVDDEGIWLHVSSSGGEFESRTFLGEGSRAMFGGEVEPGVLTLAVNRDESDSWESGRWEAMVVDVDQRTTRGIPGLGLPAEWIQVYQTGVLGSSRLFFEGDDRLVDWDPVTGEQRVVF